MGLGGGANRRGWEGWGSRAQGPLEQVCHHLLGIALQRLRERVLSIGRCRARCPSEQERVPRAGHTLDRELVGQALLRLNYLLAADLQPRDRVEDPRHVEWDRGQVRKCRLQREMRDLSRPGRRGLTPRGRCGLSPLRVRRGSRVRARRGGARRSNEGRTRTSQPGPNKATPPDPEALFFISLSRGPVHDRGNISVPTDIVTEYAVP